MSTSCVVIHEQYLLRRLGVQPAPTAGEVLCADLHASLHHRHTSLRVSSALTSKLSSSVSQCNAVCCSASAAIVLAAAVSKFSTLLYAASLCKSTHASGSGLSHGRLPVSEEVLPAPPKSRVFQQASPFAQL